MKKFLIILLCVTVILLPACASDQKVDSNDWRYQAGYEDGKRDGYGEAETRCFESGYDLGYDDGWNETKTKAQNYLASIEIVLNHSDEMSKEEIVDGIADIIENASHTFNSYHP